MKRISFVFLCVVAMGGASAAQTPAPKTATPAAAPGAPAPHASAPTASAPTTPAPTTPTTAPVEANESDVKAAGSTPAVPGVAAAAQGFTYNKENRRDPFVPLLKGQGKEVASTTVAARVAGLGGLGASEVTLRGVLASQGGYVAMLQGTDDKTYIVRTGDKLADGTIRAITSEMMVIQQQIKDPLSKQKEREVRKMLRHTDGTN